MELEPAIPSWLLQERTVAAKKSSGFKPPYDLYTSRFPRSTKDIVMAIIGVQYAKAEMNNGRALATISSYITAEAVPSGSRPSFHEVAAVTDNRGFYNVAVLAYWPNKGAYGEWTAASGFAAWWDGLEARAEHANGWFLEVFFPTVERFETLHNTPLPEGAANMREDLSGPIQEHGYWGSMRDRLPLSQTDWLVGEAAALEKSRLSNGGSGTQKNGTGPHRRVRVPGKGNLAVIRSGQDWSAALPEERTLYLETMHPVLTKGMDFLRDHGDEVGCYSCRFMEIVDPVTDEKPASTGGTDRTFGLAYFDDLASLERWSREHPTHLAIFGGFGKYAKSLGEKMSLRVFHEVLVLEPEQQLFEYIDCHEGTGMLAARW